MILQRRKLLNEAFKLIDLLIMGVSFALAFWFAAGYPSTSVLVENHLKPLSVSKAISLLILWHWLFNFFDLYGSRRFVTRWKESFDAFKASLLGSLLVNALGFFIETNLARKELFIFFTVTCVGLTVVYRMVLRWLLEEVRRRGRNLRNVLIVGTNSRARNFAHLLQSRPELGFSVLGFVDEDWPGLQKAMRETDIERVADFDDLDQYIRDHAVDEVLVALPFSTSYRESSRIVSLCEEQGITVRFISQFFDLRLAKAKIEMFEDEPVLTLKTHQMEGWQGLAKRTLDITASFVLLVLLIPLFIVVAIALKIFSPGGPVFFVQHRIGLNKRQFPLIKFRTMVPNAEALLAKIEHLNEVSGPVFKIREDPRITPLGQFLRKSSIDELPQLINVFLGHMSLVGPRPLPLRDVEGFDQDKHRRRFSVRPGITCYWQVMGRSSIPFEEWMTLDLKYIDEWNLWLDLKILLQTIPVVFKPLVFGHPGEFQQRKPLSEVLKFKNRPTPEESTTQIALPVERHQI